MTLTGLFNIWEFLSMSATSLYLSVSFFILFIYSIYSWNLFKKNTFSLLAY